MTGTTLTRKTGRSMPEPELSWHPGVHWDELQAIWAQRDEGYRKFWQRRPDDKMVASARAQRVKEAMSLTDPNDRADAYIAVGSWDPRG